ncbi:hypothetical protein CEQ90_17645 [Lewinellaceae bacterium SD302]|nr:hypothetical protein CEQ90_17645 [Lewinellaceae bacterium SD302]
MRVFNRIRRVLLEKLKIRSYFLYAFGEILLITLGVLIALYINNWNKAIDARNDEITTLTSLQENFRSNQREITATLRAYGAALRITNLRIKYTGPNVGVPDSPIIDSITGIDYIQLPYISGGSAPALSQDKLTVISSTMLGIELNRLPIQYNRYLMAEENVNVLADRLREIHQQHISLLTEEIYNNPDLIGDYHPHPSDYRGWLRDHMNQNKSVESKWKIEQATMELEQLKMDNGRILKLIDAELKHFKAGK